MQDNMLSKLTGWTSIGFGIYCLIMAIMVIAFELVYFSILFALLCVIFGSIYIASGISIVRKGQFGIIMLFGFFGSTFWWSSGIDYYYWPMIIMPIIILILMITLLIKQFVCARE